MRFDARQLLHDVTSTRVVIVGFALLNSPGYGFQHLRCGEIIFEDFSGVRVFVHRADRRLAAFNFLELGRKRAEVFISVRKQDGQRNNR